LQQAAKPEWKESEPWLFLPWNLHVNGRSSLGV